ncbi:ParA family protein (plasmid) [Serratia sp. JSRIV001]|uniref:ParA family protein n=1 Tax=unclassified Serratia (in: enterobacteria) TaxID=2647522 RepID=UPI001CC07C10|nr:MULTISPECIES: ParA family protein [unclassified Serratia (in: enterobacteria)]UAN48780.1 ParA family protein [Serratia sp. JSRIV001]UAN54469.1 ParA family protein [Serratia sp. JSRIV002]UAN60582.1 ParA family protein [Serratia sp. JSRIV004]
MAAKVIVICSQKGGIGKTFSTTEISNELQARNKRTCCVDGDWMGGLTSRQFPDGLPPEIDENPLGRTFVPGEAHMSRLYAGPDTPFNPITLPDGRGFMGATEDLNEVNNRHADCIFDFKERFEALKENYDYILIDSSPVWTNTLLANHVVADYLLIPTLLERTARLGVEKHIGTFKKIKKRYHPELKLLGVFVTHAMVSNYKKPMLEGRYAQVDTVNLEMLIEILEEQGFSEEYLLEVMPFVATKVREAIELSITIKQHDPESPLVASYDRLVDTIIARTGG